MSNQMMELHDIQISDELQHVLDTIPNRPNIVVAGTHGTGKSMLTEGLRRVKNFSWFEYNFIDDVKTDEEKSFVQFCFCNDRPFVITTYSRTIEELQTWIPAIYLNLVVIFMNYERKIAEIKYFDENGKGYGIPIKGGYPIKGLSTLEIDNTKGIAAYRKRRREDLGDKVADMLEAHENETGFWQQRKLI